MKREKLFLSMAKITEGTTPSEVEEELGGVAIDDWVGDLADGRKCTKYAGVYNIEGIMTLYFVFGRDKFNAVGTDSGDNSFKFRAVYVIRHTDNKKFMRMFEPANLSEVKRLVLQTKTPELIQRLGLSETNIGSPLNVI